MSSTLLRRVTVGLAALTGLLGTSLVGIRAAHAVTVPILVVDVDSGKVIYSQAPTDPWYPASITKLMTTYVALDLVRQGRVSLDSMITVSAAAASEPPSKMGFKPGTQLTLDNALKIIMVKSANDIAYAIGETLGGSVEGFSDMMNETARRIGMQESRWYNPNGLPDPRQWTSARDMAVLARALIRDFPDSRDLFSISAIQFGRAVMANHNGLLGRYPGTDGMKTGFICSGGFNVVASATRNGRRIVTVVMGQPSPRERDVKAADLFDYAFTQSTGWTSPTLDALPASAAAAPPDMRPYVCGGKKPPPIDDGAGAVSAPGAAAQLIGGSAATSPALALAAFSSPAIRGRTLPPRAPLQPIAVWIGHDPVEGQQALDAQEAEEKAAAANARTAKLEAAKAKRAAAVQAAADARAAKLEQAKAASAAKAAAKPTAKVAAKPAHALPRTASAYTAVETPAMPEAKPGKGLSKGPAKSAQKAAPKPAAHKAAPAKPAARKAAAGAEE